MLKFFLHTIWILIPFMCYTAVWTQVQSNLPLTLDKLKQTRRVGLYAGISIVSIFIFLKLFTVTLNKEYIDIVVNSLAIFFELGLLLMLFFYSKVKTSPSFITITQIYVGGLYTILLLLYLPDLFLVFYQIYIKGEAILSMITLWKLIGCFIALSIVAILFLVWIKILKILSKYESYLLFVVFLIIQILLQVPNILQPLLARHLVPMYSWLFNYIIMMSNQGNFIRLGVFIGLVSLTTVTIVRIYRLPILGNNLAIIRRNRVAKKHLFVLLSFFTIGSITLTILTIQSEIYIKKEVTLAPAEKYTINQKTIVINLNQVKDGHLHRFEFVSDKNIKIRIIVVKKNDVSYGVGFDACDICGATGYYEKNDNIVCKLCDVVMNRATIGFKGGCNPVPLNYKIDKNQIIIQKSDIEAEQIRFK